MDQPDDGPGIRGQGNGAGLLKVPVFSGKAERINPLRNLPDRITIPVFCPLRDAVHGGRPESYVPERPLLEKRRVLRP
ncbi:hypothetical protein FQZ97_973000 [compost metagenome]